jgi:hypothetical protein
MKKRIGLIVLSVFIAACGDGQQEEIMSPAVTTEVEKASPSSSVSNIPERRAWFGETHVHSNYSVDASIYNVQVSPDDAYRYAKGEAIAHSGG